MCFFFTLQLMPSLMSVVGVLELMLQISLSGWLYSWFQVSDRYENSRTLLVAIYFGGRLRLRKLMLVVEMVGFGMILSLSVQLSRVCCGSSTVSGPRLHMLGSERVLEWSRSWWPARDLLLAVFVSLILALQTKKITSLARLGILVGTSRIIVVTVLL